MAMEDEKKENKKRVREESEGNSVSNSKFARLDSANACSVSPEAALAEPDPDDGDVQSPEAKRIQEDLLNILDDSDTVIGPDPAIQGLDSVIKSFEEEILFPTVAPGPATSSDFGESRPVLGFLLEASDDELGLPPSFSSAEEEQKLGTVDADEEGGGSGAVGYGETMGYDFPIPSFEPFDFAIGGDSYTNNPINYSNSGDFVALGGLFEAAADISELPWRPESLSAL